MYYATTYNSPLGVLTIVCDDIGLIGLWIEGQKYFAGKLAKQGLTLKQKSELAKKNNLAVLSANQAQFTPAFMQQADHPILAQTKHWLDIYFAGQEPGFMPPLHPMGSEFQLSVWEILSTIPYGQVITYGDIAKQIAAQRGLARMSAQAVGGAVGHNPISIIVPCHRVVGSGGNLTGYAGGIDKKIALLKLEGVDVGKFSVPTKGTAL